MCRRNPSASDVMQTNSSKRKSITKYFFVCWAAVLSDKAKQRTKELVDESFISQLIILTISTSVMSGNGAGLIVGFACFRMSLNRVSGILSVGGPDRSC